MILEFKQDRKRSELGGAHEILEEGKEGSWGGSNENISAALWILGSKYEEGRWNWAWTSLRLFLGA